MRNTGPSFRPLLPILQQKIRSGSVTESIPSFSKTSKSAISSPLPKPMATVWCVASTLT